MAGLPIHQIGYRHAKPLSKAPVPSALLRSPTHGPTAQPAADQLGLERVIGKKANSPYRRGRTTDWVKVKTAHGRHIDEERAKWNE